MVKAIIYDKDGTLMQFDAFRIPVAQAAIKSIIEKYSGTNDETALKIAGETEIETGILNGVIDPNGVLCGGTAAVGRTP
ncbi:hAD-superfamily hydrolase subfamily IA variant 1 [Acidiphilium sp. CAG:727]|nr:hAD-superfamily hydrolase subfamily IA variant 1 [Acidiphilium sp. CAG:727]